MLSGALGVLTTVTPAAYLIASPEVAVKVKDPRDFKKRGPLLSNDLRRQKSYQVSTLRNGSTRTRWARRAHHAPPVCVVAG